MAITETDKILIISTFSKLGNVSRVAKHLGFDRKTVQRWVGRFNNGGSLHGHHKSGRPLLMTQDVVAAAFSLLSSEECRTANEVAVALHARGLTPRVFSRATVARALGRPGACRMSYSRKAPSKELTAMNKQQRLAFAKANLHRDWRTVLSTDRSRFPFKHPGVSVRAGKWLVPGEKYKAKTVNNPSCLNLYMGVSRFGVTAAHLVTGTCKLKTDYLNKKGEKSRSITAHEYEDVLKKTLLPGGESLFREQGIRHWHLLQDNDPAHGDAHGVVAAYNRQCACTVSILPSWPPNSPDLNPIENVWGWANRKAKAVGCKTFEEYQHTVINILKEVPLEMCKALIDSIPKRLAECIKSGGDRINY